MDTQLRKVHQMMYSNDPEMHKLAQSMLPGLISTYKELKHLRGLSLEGKPFFSYKMKLFKKKLSKELRAKDNMKINKQILRMRDGTNYKGENLSVTEK